MMGLNRTVWILTIAMFFLAICYTMLIPFLPVYLLELGTDESEVALWSGAVFSVTFLISAIMAPVWGRLSDSMGKKVMILRAGFGLAIGYFAMGFINDPLQLFISRAFLGFANGFMPAGMTLVSVSVPQEQVGKALGVYQTGNIVGSVVGPVVGGLVDSWVGMRPAFIVSGLLLAIVTAVVAVTIKEPPTEPKVTTTEKTQSMWEDFKWVSKHSVAMVLLWLSFLVQAVLLMLHPILALYVGELQGSMAGASIAAGTILSLGGISGAFTATLWGKAGQEKGYFKIISYTIFGAGLFIFLQFFSYDVWSFGILQIFVGMFTVGVLPSLSSALALSTPSDFRGRIFGMATMAQQFGNMIGPLISAVITTYIGIGYVFTITGASMLIIGIVIYCTYVMRGRELQV